MAMVNRSLILNPVEPAPFSFRAPSGLQTSVRVSLFGADGAILRQDLGLQMQLTSRSAGTIQTYSMPATDVANGKAMATIPADDLKDPNGYNVHLYGTYNSGAELLGRGVLRLTGGPGINQGPSDTIDSIPLNLSYNYDYAVVVRFWQDVGKTIPYDLTSVTPSAGIYRASNDPAMLAPFTVTPLEPGALQLSMTGAVINTLPSTCWWALRIGSATGVTTLAQGVVTITGVPGAGITK